MSLLHKLLRVNSVILLFVGCAGAAILNVGPGQEYQRPCLAIAAAADGDTIQIDAAGSYSGDACGWTKHGLTIRGVNGRPQIESGGKNADGKAIWVIYGDNTTIENVELTGAAVPDHNGAGIRQHGANLTLRNCYIHDNEEGILAGNSEHSEILIENTEFANNGYSDGRSHNIYIGRIAKFTLKFSYSHDAISGHLVKSRALQTSILYNRLTGEAGTASYQIDLPNGGVAFVVGNVVEKGPLSENPSVVSYGREGLTIPDSQLYFVNNTVVNHRLRQGPFISMAVGGTPAVVENNIFSGGMDVIDQPNAKLSQNLVGSSLFVDEGNFDYHLQSGSPARDFGVTPESVNGFPLTPVYQYVHPACFEVRQTTGAAIDAGAFEFDGGGGADSSCFGASLSAPPTAFISP